MPPNLARRRFIPEPQRARRHHPRRVLAHAPLQHLHALHVLQVEHVQRLFIRKRNQQLSDRLRGVVRFGQSGSQRLCLGAQREPEHRPVKFRSHVASERGERGPLVGVFVRESGVGNKVDSLARVRGGDVREEGAGWVEEHHVPPADERGHVREVVDAVEPHAEPPGLAHLRPLDRVADAGDRLEVALFERGVVEHQQRRTLELR